MLPEGWGPSKLSSCGVAVIDGDRGKSYPNGDDFSDQGHCLFLSAKNVTKSGFVFDELQFISEAKHRALRKGVVLKGDIVLTTRGTLVDDTMFGAVRINSGMVVLRNLHTELESDFLHLVLRSPLIARQIEQMNFGSAQPQLTVQIINNLVLPTPPRPEQRKIAEVLSTWDRAIAAVEKLIANTRIQKTALIQQLLTGPKRLPGFTGEWRILPLLNLANIRKGEQKNRLGLAATGSIPVINGGITPSGYTEAANSPANTITISEGGNSCGFVSLIETPFWCGGHCYALTGLKIDRAYLLATLKHYQSRLMALRVGSGLPNIQKKALAAFPIPVPPPAEQAAIGTLAATAEAEINQRCANLALLRQEKSALMQQLLTGKRRVKIDAPASTLEEAAA
jgi:type I restriction enzyme S subunit